MADRAEIKALALYTDKKVVLARGNTCLSCGRVKREAYKDGYHQAEADTIEKAERFFTERFEVENYNDHIDIDGTPIFNYGRFIDEFKNYMNHD